MPLGLIVSTNATFAQSVPITVGATQMLSAPVAPGQSQVVIEVPISATNSFRAEVIAPIDSPQLILLDPNGSQVGAAIFNDGALMLPPLPGGVFLTDEVVNPADGLWRFVLNFPPAVEKTAIAVTVYVATPYKTSILLSQSNYRLGQRAMVGMLILNSGLPVTDLEPKITVTSPSGNVTTLFPEDNGNLSNLDGLLNDGIYSALFDFSEEGTYLFLGHVNINLDNGVVVERTALATSKVVAPAMNINSVTTFLARDISDCISSVSVRLNAEVLNVGVFLGRVILQANNGNTIDGFGKLEQTSVGLVNLDINFPSNKLLMLGEDGPYTISLVDLLSLQSDIVGREAYVVDVATTPEFALSDLCGGPSIKIGTASTVTPDLQDNYIGSLKIEFPVKVATAGDYQISFKVTNSAHQEVGQYNIVSDFNAGDNTISVSIPYSQLQASDGPFQVETIKVSGPDGEGAAPVSANNTPFMRWQFYPSVNGDLDGNGRVDFNDRNILLSFRGHSALRPGDRRDLNRDGVIDLRDVYILQGLK